MEEQKQKFDWKHLLITVTLVLVAAAAVGGTTYYVLNQNFQKEREANEKALSLTKNPTQETTLAKAEIPTDYSSVELNGATVYYPKSFGSPKVETTKASGEELTPGTTFDGAYANFADYQTTISVNDISSYNIYPAFKTLTDYLKSVYAAKTIKPEDVLSLNAKGLLPMPNAKVSAYSPRYVSSSNGKWRGYWYLAHISQGFSPSLTFVSVMTDNEKVLTIMDNLKTSKLDSLKAELDNTKDDGLNAWELKMQNYTQTAYSTDKDVQAFVDGTMLKMCSLVK